MANFKLGAKTLISKISNLSINILSDSLKESEKKMEDEKEESIDVIKNNINKENTSVVICGKKYDIGTRVVLWDEPGGLNGYLENKKIIHEEDRHTGKQISKVISGKRYSKRSIGTTNLSSLQKIVTQFFLHHSGLYRSKVTYEVLHNERKLSSHFILDDDGTIYQTLDLIECAWHGGKNNSCSVGIEIDSRAMANKFPDAYDEKNQKLRKVLPREKQIDQIHGNWILGYTYNDKQYNALIRLGILMSSVFPKMNNKNAFGKQISDFPRDSNGRIEKKLISEPLKHCGFICHLHTSKNKVDPISFDYHRFLMGVVENNPNKKSTYLFDSHKTEKENYELKLNSEKI